VDLIQQQRNLLNFVDQHELLPGQSRYLFAKDPGPFGETNVTSQ